MQTLVKKTQVTDVESTDLTADPVNVDASSYARLGWLIVLFGVGGFVLWSLFAPLDQGVPVSGNVTVSSNRKAIQHQTGGTIDDILVKEGDVVKAGQPLVRMNDVQAKAIAESTRVTYITARAVEARLLAERDGKGSILFPPELTKQQNDPLVASAIATQNQLFASRQGAIHSEIGAVEESIAGSKAQLQGLTEGLESQKQQQKFLKEQLDGMRDLAKDGYVARNRLLELERTYAQISGAISENIGNIGRTQRQIGELTLRMSQRKQEYQKEVRAQLADIQREAESQENRFKSTQYDLANAFLRAPVDGIVVGMNVFTRGGVIGPGYRVMDLVPSDDPLVVEANVPVHLIDKVQVDLPVEMMFSAFNSNQTPHIPGVVTQVSADRMVDEKSGTAFYRMKVKVTPEGTKLLAHHQVRPGMPVEVFVKTGERTMANYLMKPLLDRAKTSLTEQ